MKTKVALIAAVLLATAVSAHATAFLKRTWFDKGKQWCEYSNGTVFSVSGRPCPVQIEE